MLSNHNYSKKAQKPPYLSDNPMQFKCTMDTTIRLAVQRDLTNKQGSKSAHGHGWKTTELTITELWKHITRSGNAFCTSALTSEHRKTENFESAWGILLDLDENSLQEAQSDPFIHSIASFGFTTPSHTEQNPRCKIACVFDTPVTDPVLFRRYVQAVMSRVKTVTVDTSGKDATRFSYGNQDGQWAFYGKGLSVDWLNEIVAQDVLATQERASIDTPKQQNTETHTYQNIIQLKRGNIWLDENARRIVSKIGVTTYNVDGYSNPVHCPCSHHKNGDANPSAAWHRDRYHLHCFASDKNYTVKETASMLGIKLDNTSECRPGLFNGTRKFLLGHIVKSDSGRKTSPLETFSRFLDAMRLYGNGSGWYPLKGDDTTIGLDAALNSLFADNTLRYSIGNNLLDSDEYQNIQLNEDDKGVFCAVVLLNSSKDISYNQVDNDVKNYLTVPPPPIQSGNGRPKKYYFVPTEQELAKALGFEMGVYRDYISLADIQSNSAYTESLHRVLIEQRPGKYSQKFLGARIGKSARTVRRYTKKNPDMKTRINEQVLGIATDEVKIPVKPIAHRHFAMADSRTGEMKKFSYCREMFRYLKQFNQPIYTVQQIASSYWSLKGKPLPEKDNQRLELAS